MGADAVGTQPPIPFSAWLSGMRAAIDATADSVVPCGSCTACCTSSQFVHIEPDETDTRAHIPAELLFPAPRRPEGHQLLGYDERGHCPMLVEGACSIYEHRPRACRTYDCRVFAATGIEPGDESKSAIAIRVHQWRFAHRDEQDRVEHQAVRAAAASLARHDDGDLDRPRPATEQAVWAVEHYRQFLAD